MEVRKVFDNVQGISGGLTSTGTLRLTDFHLVFCAAAPSNQSSKDASPRKIRESWITYPILSYCAFRPTPPASGIPSSIRIRCRDFTFVTFNFQDDKVAREAFEFIRTRTCKLGTVEKLYAFSHKPLKTEESINGWELYDARAEFRRQGISEKSSDKGWRISTINQDYKFCDTYPGLLVVPSSISDLTLKYAKDFRSRCRIPALSYLHPINGCTILRSSQPHAGITRKTNTQDEKLVCAAFSSNMRGGMPLDASPPRLASEPSSQSETPTDVSVRDDASMQSDAPEMYDSKGKRLIYGAQQSNLIVDARPTINAIFNQMQGYGSENMEGYKNSQKVFLNIDNIHVMRSSLNQVIEAIKDADISALPPNQDLLAKSGWIRHIFHVLSGAIQVAKQVGINHSHVLIHCSDGWDRTSQLSALAQIMLDPYYRTLEGFMVLVEKDWLSFGHMFRLRSGHLSHEDWFVVQRDALAGSTVQPGENDGRGDALQNALDGARRLFGQVKPDPQLEAMTEAAPGEVVESEMTTKKMVSPVFHQFLDCVYQMQRQFPDRFEFNERFLRRLLYHLYSCQYGTFLYNSEKQRHDAKVYTRTSSVWDYFLSRRSEFTNPNFNSTIDDHVKGRERLLFPDIKEIRWWHQVFNRSDEEMNASLDAMSAIETDRATMVAGLQVRTGAAIQSNSQPTTPSRPLSPKPPTTLATSQSALDPIEPAKDALTAEAAVPALHRSASADAPGAFSTIRDGLAGLKLLNPLGRTGEPSTTTVSAQREQEMREMT
ncbi:hypothetical protein jhhlp_002080 [Lomentospora prolificans]|uniref:Myotubularin phosphatase domain-containing protein n=1 Tax=Lomentospora prolificans TaxID=41688 RepID=A0A2N3ND23_9PEZI|nr:hypothetical protein jhhlp_002080 [Lomentospora prolificans]